MTTDAELLYAWREGDAEAGGRLFERYFDAISRFFFNKAGSDPEDLVQETFAHCVRGRDKVRDFRSYVFGVAHNVLCGYIRRKRRPDDPDEAGRCRAHDLGPGPSTAVLRREEQRILLEGLRRIPFDYQIVLELHYWEGMTTARIGEILDVPTGTIRSRLKMGRDKLERALKALSIPAAVLESTMTDLEGWARTLRETVGGSPPS